MTKEQIEQKAKEYTNKNDTIVMGFEENLDCTEQMQQAFIDGYHECEKTLIEATEIIKELLDTQYRLDPYRDIFKIRVLRAEQFLKETEK